MRHTLRLRPLLLFALAALAAQAGDRSITGAPLAWKPTSTLSESLGALNLLPFTNSKIWIKPFTDSRKDKEIVGENQEKVPVRTIATKDDAANFLTQNTLELYRTAGLPLAAKVEEATVVVSAEVLKYKVIERDTYKAELSLMMQVEVGGKLVWRGTVMGESTRWGRSFKLENYHEALSDSLISAVGQSLKSDPFLNALAGKAPAVP